MILIPISTPASPIVHLKNPVTGELICEKFNEYESENIQALTILNLFHNHYPENQRLNTMICNAIYDYQDANNAIIDWEPVGEEFLNLLTTEILEFGEVEYLFRLLGVNNEFSK
jgi:hypothetical protein